MLNLREEVRRIVELANSEIKKPNTENIELQSKIEELKRENSQLDSLYWSAESHVQRLETETKKLRFEKEGLMLVLLKYWNCNKKKLKGR